MDRAHATKVRVPRARRGRVIAVGLAATLAFTAGTGAVWSSEAPELGHSAMSDPTTAAAATPGMVSSFSPVVSDGTIVGGTQAITVVNSSDGAVPVVLPLEPAPCACALVSATASTGDVRFPGGSAEWSIDELAPGGSATIDITWTDDAPTR